MEGNGMSVRGRILNSQSELSAAERKVAEFILQNPNKTIQMTAVQLATASGSSPASVIRLTKHLEIDSFTTLKILLSSDLTKNQSDPKMNDDIRPNEDLNSIKGKLLTSALESIRETTDQLNRGEVTRLVKAIIGSNQLFLFGVGASNLVAENISQKWNRIGYPTVADDDLNSLVPKLVNAKKGGILWVISNSGESPEVLIAAKNAKKYNLKLVSLTRFGKNSLAKLSDIAVHTSQPKESPNRIAATNSLLAQFMIIDIIFYYFVSQTYDSSSKVLIDSHNAIEQYKRGLQG
ncbi:transcriptional regulator RpiR family protein [Companilactobacillus paralimentarius DSM 13238 = JCM 10415]|uniref:Transcriptional regulator RpiR family protein n=2 Tax=Companilactobacillus paralimentarius TaxID=83526 RepID=A0A0R1PP65_9LACO|nr:MurR/RpiR family transcriptional regulator [Companilactobacillus paralimentarius]KRL32100.1 transcriptional regulator RpiR family protein [Companilactobacillus paralimentarius DSM 13238 = JCM 10415]